MRSGERRHGCDGGRAVRGVVAGEWSAGVMVVECVCVFTGVCECVVSILWVCLLVCLCVLVSSVSRVWLLLCVCGLW